MATPSSLRRAALVRCFGNCFLQRPKLLPTQTPTESTPRQKLFSLPQMPWELARQKKYTPKRKQQLQNYCSDGGARCWSLRGAVSIYPQGNESARLQARARRQGSDLALLLHQAESARGDRKQLRKLKEPVNSPRKRKRACCSASYNKCCSTSKRGCKLTQGSEE